MPEPLSTTEKVSNWFDREQTGQKFLACFYPVNDPLMPRNYLDIYHDAGVDIIELGLPVKDPYMDGPTVTQSLKRALDSTNYMQEFAAVSRYIHRLENRPALICMTYAQVPRKQLFESSVWREIDALLMVGFDDVKDDAEIRHFMAENDVRFVNFIDHNLDGEMVTRARRGNTYVMLQAARGKTGSGLALSRDNGSKISALRQQGLKRPILLGFGIYDPVQVREALDYGADGVIIGSACLEKGLQGPEVLRDYLHSVREILDAG